MTKKLFVLLTFLLLITGCKSANKIDLNNEYYNKGEFITIDNKELDKLDGNFIVFVHNNFCAMGVPCEEIFKDVMEECKIDFLKIQFDLYHY